MEEFRKLHVRKTDVHVMSKTRADAEHSRGLVRCVQTHPGVVDRVQVNKHRISFSCIKVSFTRVYL